MGRMEVMEYNDESAMPYGLHQGKKMKHVPARYLLYIYTNHSLFKSVQGLNLMEYIEKNMDSLNKRAGQNVQKFVRE